MLFNSIDFAVFLPIVFFLYWFVTNKNLKLQNLMLVAASCVFYGWWDYRFLILVLLSIVMDYSIGLFLGKLKEEKHRKILLFISVAVNLGFLGFFKYFNFFVDSFVNSFTLLGLNFSAPSLNIVLPVGISFYTFQTMSYTIDVYRRKLEPTKDIISFSAFVIFFPQLVAGPIERATNLLPQFYSRRVFDYSKAVDGMRQILWGLFKKVVIADNCAGFANMIFNGYDKYSGITLFMGAVFFALQIYCDFSGYSDIAIGTSRLFGINLMRNFSFPYFSRDIAEFWRRWHISLTTWFRDYVYIPLGGSKGTTLFVLRNTIIVFVVSGFWHGSKWTFVAWGLFNAILFIPLLLIKSNRKNLDIVAQGRILPSIKDIFSIGITFFSVVTGWIFFRSETLMQSLSYIYKMFTGLISIKSYVSGYTFLITEVGFVLPIVIIVFMLIEWLGRESQFAIEKIGLNWNKIYRYGFYYSIVILIFVLSGEKQDFIYFQF